MNIKTTPIVPIDLTISRRAFVAFTTQTDLPLLRYILPRSFRHCSVHINDGVCWTSLESLSGYTEIMTHDCGADFDLPDHLCSLGFTVIEAPLYRDAKAHRIQIPAFFSCVEAVKRVLGLHKPLIVTPSQLYRALQKESQK